MIGYWYGIGFEEYRKRRVMHDIEDSFIKTTPERKCALSKCPFNQTERACLREDREQKKLPVNNIRQGSHSGIEDC